jgi:hypothetical protein
MEASQPSERTTETHTEPEKLMNRTRSGLRIRGQRGHPSVREALKRFARWLRQEYYFPIRVPVYLNKHRSFVTIEGEEVTASFFAPYDRNIEPYIRIATGDYEELVVKYGKNDALASYLCSLAHEIVHYRQWIADGNTSEEGVEEEADAILQRYAQTVDVP